MAEKTFLQRLKDDPAIRQLGKTAAGYATARVEKMSDKATSKAIPDSDDDSFIDAGKKEAKRRAIMPAIKGFFSGAWNKLFHRKGSTKRPTHVMEEMDVGAPVDVVWDAWNQFDEFPGYMKGPQSVKEDTEEQDGEQKRIINWQAKIFWSKRNWKSTIQEQVENQRLRWTSEANKGTVEGTVTFTPIGENLTTVLLVMEYRPKGFFEKIGNTWRIAGRRTRLDFKHFNRHVTMSDQSEQPDQEEPPTDEQRDEPESTEPEQPTEQPAESGTDGEQQPDGEAESGGTGSPEGGTEGEEGEPPARRRTRRPERAGRRPDRAGRGT